MRPASWAQRGAMTMMDRTSRCRLRDGVATAPYRRSGLTLIELVVVMAIITLLAAVVTASMWPSGEIAAKGAAKAQLTAVRAQIEGYRLRNKGLVPSEAGLDGTANLWHALTTSDQKTPALLKNVPELPEGFNWNWDGSRLWLTYVGENATLGSEAPSW